MRTFCNKNRVSFTLGFANTQINIRILYFILVVSTVHSIVKRNVILYFCNIFVIMYCTVAVVVDTVHSCPVA